MDFFNPREFFVTKAFGKTVDLIDPTVIRAKINNITSFVVMFYVKS
jgi:hypothetical protein